MPRYLLSFHGGKAAETPEEGIALRDAWLSWMGSLGDALVDGGGPTGPPKTRMPDGTVLDGGGANPVSGYTMIQAPDLDTALELIAGCPIFANGGSTEVAELLEM